MPILRHNVSVMAGMSNLRLSKSPTFAASVWLSVLLALTSVGCTPKVNQFQVTIPGNTIASPSDIADHQGSTHVCPGTEVQLSWDASGKVTLSATKGQIYQPPTCFTSRVPAKGTKLLVTTPEIASACSDTAVLRLTATHSLWHRSGYCPGPGCPGADHEVVVRSETEENIGGKTDQCTDDAFEVTNFKAAVDWDDHYRIESVSVPPRIAAYLKTSGRHLAVFHNNKQAVFTSEAISSDAFRGEKFAGAWKLRLSGCGTAPPALVVTARLICTQ
jgi:hypothetical protein